MSKAREFVVVVGRKHAWPDAVFVSKVSLADRRRGGLMPKIPFDMLVAEIRKIAHVTVVSSYARLKAALDRGDDRVWDFAETLTLAAVVEHHGSLKQHERLREEIMASRLCTELMRTEEQ